MTFMQRLKISFINGIFKPQARGFCINCIKTRLYVSVHSKLSLHRNNSQTLPLCTNFKDTFFKPNLHKPLIDAPLKNLTNTPLKKPLPGTPFKETRTDTTFKKL